MPHEHRWAFRQFALTGDMAMFICDCGGMKWVEVFEVR